jgi:nicotinate-nucleotide adenylyltransferase
LTPPASGSATGRAPLGLFGGTFDPVHCGHLRAALEVRERCGLGELRLVPAGRPPHRSPPQASAAERLALLRAAVADEPRLVVDDRELWREGPSYTVDTLLALRAERPGTPLCLVLGADACLGLPRWHRWREILQLAHLIVMPRPGWTLQATGELAGELGARLRTDAQCLRSPTGGQVVEQPVTALDISATAIRALLATGGDPRYLVPEAVRQLLLRGTAYRQLTTATTTIQSEV